MPRQSRSGRGQGFLRPLLRNIARARRFHLLWFRLLTFGLYEPRVAWLLLRHTPSYGRWLVEMETMARDGAAGWWERQAGLEDVSRLRDWMDAENSF